MKNIDKGAILKSLIIAIIVPVAFFLFEFYIRQQSAIPAGIAAGIMFAILVGLIIFFQISARMSHKKIESEKEI